MFSTAGLAGLELYAMVLVPTLLAVVGLLVAEWREHALGRGIFKTLASLGFVVAALGMGPFVSAHGTCFVAGLLLSLVGDLCLLRQGTGPAFRLGIAAFLLAHLAYACAFLLMGVDPVGVGLALLPLVGIGLGVNRWLASDLPPALKLPVKAYVCAISLMVAMGLGAWMQVPDLTPIPWAVSLFFLSDLAVARQRFKTQSLTNKLLGLPLYYVAQLLFALLALITFRL